MDDGINDANDIISDEDKTKVAYGTHITEPLHRVLFQYWVLIRCFCDVLTNSQHRSGGRLTKRDELLLLLKLPSNATKR